MDLNTHPAEDRYDVIVVGSGLGGISAAAFLAKAGKKVLVVERLDGPGGFAHAFRRGPYLIDPALHNVGEVKEGQMLDTWLRALGVRDQCNFIPLHSPLCTLFLPGYRFDAPFGVEEFQAALIRDFPHEAEGIRSFFKLCMQIKLEYIQRRPADSLQGLARAAEGFETLLKYRGATTGQALDEFITDPRPKAACSPLWGYCGVPPSRLSLVTFAGMMISILEGGLSYCEGSFQNLVNAFVHSLKRDGGELVVKKRVSRINVQDGHVTGVTLEDGRPLAAAVVISNADATQTFLDLVGAEHLPAPYLRRLSQLKASGSAFMVYSATTLDIPRLNLAHETFVYSSWDYDEVERQIGAGKAAAISIRIPTLADPALAPPGEHIVSTLVLMPFDIGVPWREARDRYTEMVLDQVEAYLPGYRAGLIFAEGSTPLALHRYSLALNGAMHGWENNPNQTQSRRLGHRTPIEGLHLSGAWTQPGSGANNCMQSGLQTAQIVLGATDQAQFLRDLTASNR